MSARRGRRGGHHVQRLFFAERDQPRRLGSKSTLRIGFELVEAGDGAEVVGDAVVLIPSGSRRGIDGHAANRIDRHISPFHLLQPPWTRSVSSLPVEQLAWENTASRRRGDLVGEKR